ncbi:uncharacterized protein LOC141630329 [Silene latifolia]|uniref:uncharacterized protein LOC141630329 n=1 Tax=Silene latifolia TaxID=37657 RepID=UPI003D77B907
MKDTWSKVELANGYRKHVVKLHGVPKDIVFDRDTRFISRFWQELQSSLGTTLKRNIAFHLATDRKTKRTIQTLEDMLRDCVMDVGFEVGDKVLLKVSPMWGVMIFGKWGKLSKKFIVPYEILDRVREVAYHFALPPVVECVYNVFHVSQLRKYVSDQTHVLEVDNIELDDALTYAETPKEILGRKVRETRH